MHDREGHLLNKYALVFGDKYPAGTHPKYKTIDPTRFFIVSAKTREEAVMFANFWFDGAYEDVLDQCSLDPKKYSKAIGAVEVTPSLLGIITSTAKKG